ncbi:MAG: hypothetical protein N2383_11475 [Caldilineales bacterium]|nr:hypothetical protein [Caldilineales bacterium]
MAVAMLAAAELVPDRPFTHPRHIADDGEALRYMARALLETARRPELYAGRPLPVVYFYREPDGRYHRQVLIRPERLEGEHLAIVGFFGWRRPDADRGPIERMDAEMLAELPQQEGLLAYCSLALRAGEMSAPTVNFGNLVVFAGPEAKARWHASERHRYAASVLAPGYYASVRIYNGLLPHGLSRPESLQLHLVKYFDYTTQPAWLGQRTLS